LLDIITGPCSFNFEDEIVNNINSKRIDFDEFKEENPIHSLDKKIPEIIIPIESSSSESDIKIERKKIFLPIYPKRVTIFTKAENKFEFIKINSAKEFINKKRRRNKEDDIRRMIGRRFFNDVLLNLINAILKNAGCKNIFEKFQQDVIYYLVKKFNKNVFEYDTNFYIEQYIYYNYHFIDNFLDKNYT
jgi:hypothetical protein